VFCLFRYWAENPPTHVLLALRYLGEGKKGNPTAANARAHSQAKSGDKPQNIAELARFIGAPVGKIDDRTRQLYEYAQLALNPKKGAL
jgi:hypothetical protein